MISSADGLLVQRLFERLLVAVGVDDREGPITIGDLYQRLIPYRSVRSEIGVMELASYEHGLLRLLGGESGYLEVEGETAAEEIRRELASPNPILGIYRDYADVRVRIVGTSNVTEVPGEPGTDSLPGARTRGAAENPSGPSLPAARQIVSGDTASAGTATERSVDEPVVGAGTGPVRRTGPRAVPATPAPGATGVTGSAAPAVCAGCGKSLPAVSGIRFCPYCGQVREPLPCGACGTRLEPEWNYCIRCGAPTES